MAQRTLLVSFTAAVLTYVLAVVLYDVMGAVVKHLSDRYSTQQLTVFRNLFGLIPAVAVLWTSRAWAEAGRPFVLRQWPLAILRGVIGVGAQMVFYLSLIHLELATAATLAFATPFFVTALSVPVLKTRIGFIRWAAVVVGFLGVVLIINPEAASFSWYAILPVIAACGYGANAVTAKLFDADVPTPLINIYYTLTALVGSLLFTTFTSGFSAIEFLSDWAWLLAMGLAGGFAALCMTAANRMADPSSLSPFQYFGVPSSFLLGWLFFAEAPFETLFPGVVLIVGAGLLILWRENKFH